MKVWNRKPFFVIATSSKFSLLSFLFVSPKSYLIWWYSWDPLWNFQHRGMRMLVIGIIKRPTLLQNYLQFLPRKDCKIQIEFPPFYRLKSVSKLLTEAIRRCHLELLPIWIFRYFPEKAQSSGPTPPLHDWFWGIQFHPTHPQRPAVLGASMCGGEIKYKGGS